jgi:hypothetical protein
VPLQWARTLQPVSLPVCGRDLGDAVIQASTGALDAYIVRDIPSSRSDVVSTFDHVSLHEVQLQMLHSDVTCVLVYANGLASPIGMVHVWMLADLLGRGLDLRTVPARLAMDHVDMVSEEDSAAHLVSLLCRHVFVRETARVISQGDLLRFLTTVPVSVPVSIPEVIPVSAFDYRTPMHHIVSAMVVMRQFIVVITKNNIPRTVLSTTDLRRVQSLAMSVGEFLGLTEYICTVAVGSTVPEILRVMVKNEIHHVLVSGREGSYMYSVEQILMSYL